jgi:hypothetical protein
MSHVIFENSTKLTVKDIYLQILVGLSILFIVGLLSPLRNHRQSFSWTSFSFLIFAGVLLVIWIIKAVRETTLQSVEIQAEQGKVTFVLDRQLRGALTVDFQLNSLHLNMMDVPDRSLPRKKLLTIKDNYNELKLSSRQKGLSEAVFNGIVEKLKHYPQHKL